MVKVGMTLIAVVAEVSKQQSLMIVKGHQAID